MFRRRDRRGLGRAVWEVIYPKGGWKRAYFFLKHRLQRLPGTPEQIARGLAIGVFTAFSPFYGLHFIVAALLAVLLRANILASLLGTFFGNPLTYIPIGAAALGTGYSMLGQRLDSELQIGLGQMFIRALSELWYNFKAIFTVSYGDWTYLAEFWDTVFFPWLVGGLPPGIVSGLVAYYISVPTIRGYKNRRKGLLASKLA
ncbi:MAG: DUF2062 domain-containing protein, partial [Planktomarina sp.]|nr:DUF2062 domain-containing protein [Planktomarina sp.]